MGLLDAEGYKFLEESDSPNSDGQEGVVRQILPQGVEEEDYEEEDGHQEMLHYAQDDAGQPINQILSPQEDLIYEMRPPVKKGAKNVGAKRKVGRKVKKTVAQDQSKVYRIEQLNFDNIQINAPSTRHDTLVANVPLGKANQPAGKVTKKRKQSA